MGQVKNVTSEDSNVKGTKLHTYYCSVCGTYAVVADSDIFKLPKRRADRAYCMDENKSVHEKYVKPGQRVLVKREGGVETQERFVCKDCGQQLGYRSKGAVSYFWPEALVDQQSFAATMQ